MKLDDLEKEMKELGEDICIRGKKATVDYRGSKTSYEQNKKKAVVGGLVGLVTYPFIPIVGIGALTYGGIKAYQAYKDKKNGSSSDNNSGRGSNTPSGVHTIGGR